MATPLNMPATKTVKTARPVSMTARHSGCADKGACVGPGCRVSTGKTARKAGL